MLEAFDSRAFGAMLFVFGAAQLPAAAAGLFDDPQPADPAAGPADRPGADAPWLPRRMIDRPLKRDDLRGLFRKLTPVVKRMELITKPRLSWLFTPLGERMIGVVCTLLALVLVLPIPLGNLAPGATVASCPWRCCKEMGCWRWRAI
jgi:hypothetical protein